MAVDFNPEIGKNVIETLTMGMYDDPRFIFREYIQNAADQIDVAVEQNILRDRSEGLIIVSISPTDRKIEISDNATGIQSTDILQFLGDVANSQKDQTKRKGFRGIGRLGGLGYCEKLTFVTSYKGEPTQSTMSLDAQLLRSIIHDKQNTSNASKVISLITSIDSADEEADLHYFKVKMEGVDSKLLDEIGVKGYLEMVAPIPFHENFTFQEKIKLYYTGHSVIMDEYVIFLNEKQLFKSYKNKFEDEEGETTLIDIGFIEFRSASQELLALCWYGYRERSNIVLIAPERGIRIRTKNISIGDEATCNRFFDQQRTNIRFIGEIHTLSENFIPNARRDYFVENSTLSEFEGTAKTVFKKENLENRLAHTASQLYNRKKEIDAFLVAQKEYDEKKDSFNSTAEERHYSSRLKVSQERAVKANNVLKGLKAKGEKDPRIKNLYDKIVGDLTGTDSLDNYSHPQQSQYDPPIFNKLSDDASSAVREIFGILEDNLPFETSELIKKIIIERFNQ
jgi:hypothetical protein